MESCDLETMIRRALCDEKTFAVERDVRERAAATRRERSGSTLAVAFGGAAVYCCPLWRGSAAIPLPVESVSYRQGGCP
jgi:hypothetical protein